MKISVDDDVCVGHGRCYALAPDVFGPDDFGHCTVVQPEVADDSAAAQQARIGATNCPEGAITLG